MIRWPCPKCYDTLEVPESLALTLVECPKCGSRSTAPAALSAPLPRAIPPQKTQSFSSPLSTMMKVIGWLSIVGGTIGMFNGCAEDDAAAAGGGAAALLSGILWLALVEIILRLREIASLLRARTNE